MGAEISTSRSRTLTGSLGPTLSRLRLMKPKTFFFVQSVVREYLLVGVTGSLIGDEVVLGELALW